MTAATRLVIVDEPSVGIVLALYVDGHDEAIGRIVLGPADAICQARDLLNAACRRYGRLTREQMEVDSLGSYDEALRALRRQS